ncbi:hypothetical protein C4D60_Mb06t31490 [Musa balbisiana]|uniref:Cytochrome P450 family protein n=1 Tax=Musa balbisiana TaxID=52838 RepID=A0A4S8IS72_MUSBA|nr:hypothetical protein C4D60_Mb06t31490 [Musa balbisiana]
MGFFPVVDSAFYLLFVSNATALPSITVVVILTLAVICLYPGGLSWALSRGGRSIPGPPGMVLGLSGSAAHRVLARLAASLKAADLMAFSFGLTCFVVSSRPDTAREILNSSAFADRPVKESAYELLFHRAMGFAPFGDYWRTLRRISATYLFSPARIAAFGEHRRAIGQQMIHDVMASMETNGVVALKKVLHFGSLNNVMMSVFGKRFDFGKHEGVELEELVTEGYELLGKFNWSDHFPMLRWMDPQGIRKRMVLHQDIQSKVQSEIDAVVGTLRLVSDADIPNLPYLQFIVKESLRLHPPGPLLSWARLAVHDAYVGDHFIPAGTTAMVNMWAITHDERIWEDPDEFKPERFAEENVSILGCDLRLAPFGAGRRVCPGKAFALATVHLWLAQLLQSFTWVSEGSAVDMSECLKMSLEMKKPLVCRAFPRN